MDAWTDEGLCSCLDGVRSTEPPCSSWELSACAPGTRLSPAPWATPWWGAAKSPCRARSKPPAEKEEKDGGAVVVGKLAQDWLTPRQVESEGLE